MGFLERLRQEKERKDLEQAELREQEVRAKALIEAQEVATRQEYQKREEQARLFNEESGILDMLNEMKKPLVADVGSCRDKNASVFNTFRWDAKSQHDKHKGDYYIGKYFEVEVTFDGYIKFLASKSGSSAIQRAQWLGNRLVLEEALEKAYSHPTTITWNNHPVKTQYSN